jgi:hypothetical protein
MQAAPQPEATEGRLMSTTENDLTEFYRAARFDRRELRCVGTEFYDVDELPDLADVVDER